MALVAPEAVWMQLWKARGQPLASLEAQALNAVCVQAALVQAAARSAKS